MTSRLSPLVGCLAALLALSTHPATAFAQSAPASAAVAAAAPARLLVAHPVVAALTTALVRDTGIVVLRPVPETLPPNRQLAFFSGRGAAGLGEAARQADAVIALRSIWPDDPLFPLARRQNIRLIEIDAARPLDASLPGMALQEQDATANALPWLDPVNLGRMADVIASDVGRLVPAAKPRLQANVGTLRQQLLSITAQSEARLASASNLAVFSLSDRLDYLVSGFNLDLAGTDARADEAWTPEAIAQWVQRLRSASVAAVLHHRELPPAVAQAVQQAGVRSIVLLTEGRDPVAELRENAQRLGAIATTR
ncbi:MAG: zinc ABC transporter substrate-binding protein [Hydrogenophaga sp.]|uniref:metal ABC transporter solute-binding protein, Zn/Mn family n=1 Tax=Hydrogenophaga sp. TaxID=1904254 RepID=UPI00262AED9F|nr:zinc ABC transporter substrate-binding protein [Hydrogenophaga sp.]MCW5670925.1 zinc ABC transporter substrate-binding protein [Hydrogenophaga sp.]